MQLGEYHFDTGNTLLRMDIDRHSPAIIYHRHRVIVMQNNAYLSSKTRNSLIDTVINNFLRKVIWTRGVRVHTRSFFDRIKTGKNFY